MSELKGKIDFVVLVSAKNANPNGDPLNGNSLKGMEKFRRYVSSGKSGTAGRIWGRIFLCSRTNGLMMVSIA